MRITFRLKNIGSGLARLVAEVYGDTVSWEPILRRHLLEVVESKREAVRHLNSMPTELLPGDSMALSYNFGICYPEGDSVVIHALIMYSNDVGNLYDTYLRAGYVVIPPEFSIQGKIRDGALGMLIITRRARLTETVFLYALPKPLFEVYDSEDSRRVISLLQSWKDAGPDFVDQEN
ncbi:MAG: hypothetical protein IPI01_06420 [Ignavibacteriae bacterium]|nr:hypothetical protein [Ignavibacteriota bacterium]